jgi:rubrerythrin
MVEDTKEKDVEEEIKERYAQYQAFLASLFDKHKELKKFADAIKNLRENATKQDLVLKTQINDAINEVLTLATKPEHKDKVTIPEVLNNARASVLKVLQTYTNERKNVDKYIEQVVANFTESLLHIDELIIAKILELIANIDQAHMEELESIKLELAEWVRKCSELQRENEALKQGIKPKLKEIPSELSIQNITIQCPVCKQAHEVSKGTKVFKCNICGYEINVNQ